MDGEQILLRVENMACPSCAGLIEKKLRGAEGILDVEASFATDRVRVTFHPGRLSPEEIVERVEAIGYRAADATKEASVSSQVSSDALRLGVTLFLTANVMMLSFSLYHGFFQDLGETTQALLGWPILVLATGAVFWGGLPIFGKAVVAARIGRFQMETLISLGAGLAWTLSVVNLLRGSIHLYFDTASMLVSLILLGTFIESMARKNAARAVTELDALLPRKGRLVEDGAERYVGVEEMGPGSQARVLAGEVIPADGVVIEGDGLVDNAALTGESDPVRVSPGAEVNAATTLLDGEIRFEITFAGEASAAGKMVALMERAVASKSPFEKLADRIAPPFVLAVIGIAVVTSAVMLLNGASPESTAVRAVTVLVVACPCTLGIAIPLAKVAAVGAGRKARLLIADADALEIAADVKTVVFDKTGTVTDGCFGLRRIWTDGMDGKDALGLAASVEQRSHHPLGRAIVHNARDRGVATRDVPHAEELEGLGVRGDVEGETVLVGSRKLLEDHGVPVSDRLLSVAGEERKMGYSVVFVAGSSRAVAGFSLGDAVRSGMAAAVEKLHESGIDSWLLSGDAEETTAAVAAHVGIRNHRGGVLPHEKVETVEGLARKGKVAMVGDGINDAAAIAAADVGMAVGRGMNVAREAADVGLMGEGAPQVNDVLALSRLTRRKVRANLGLALLYNAVAIPLAVGGLITPLVAVTAMLCSSLIVVINSARILKAFRKSDGNAG